MHFHTVMAIVMFYCVTVLLRRIFRWFKFVEREIFNTSGLHFFHKCCIWKEISLDGNNFFFFQEKFFCNNKMKGKKERGRIRENKQQDSYLKKNRNKTNWHTRDIFMDR